jgi:ATP-dependent helicase/nuclease subunit B
VERVSPALLAAVASGRTVLAPNTELANALFDAVQRVHRDAGDEVWPTPRVHDYSSWLREQHVQRQLSEAIAPRLLSEVEERELWRTVIDTAQIGKDFLDPAGAARAARRARRTLFEYAIPIEALDPAHSEECAAFLEWNRVFERRCSALGCVSADSLLADLGSPGGLTSPGGLASAWGAIDWIESPQWRPAARRWLERNGRVLRPQRQGQAGLSIVRAPSPAAELAAIADWARGKLAEDGFRAWICVPDLNRRRAEVVDAFDAALAPQRFALRGESGPAPYAVAGGTPLADYAPVRAALELLTASVGTVSFVQFSALLRAPELHDSDSEAGSAARLDVALRRRASNDADFEGWLDLADRVARAEQMAPAAAVQRLRAAHQVLSQLQGARLFSEWVAVWMGALQIGSWAFSRRWSSIEYQAAERFRELLAGLAMGDAVFGTHSRDSAQRILARAARETAFQVQTGVPAIWVSGQLLDPWLDYSGLWVSGCNDEQWPQPVAPVALLPVGVQRQYGVIPASAESQLALAIDLQSRWQERANQCVFSFSDSGAGTGAGSSSMPSPLLPKIVPADLTASPQPHWRKMQERAPGLESVWDEQAPPYAVSERTRGVATLRAQSRCAFRGFAETRLDAQPLEQPVPGFNERERGELVHHALQHVWTALGDSNALQTLRAEAEQRLIDEASARAIESVCQRRDPGRRWRQREGVRLRNLLTTWLQLERTRAPFIIEALEGRDQIARFGGLEFRVRIDRVDRLSDGARVLIDYKTGAAEPDWRGERPDNPQLPVYALLSPDALIAVAYAKVNAAECRFVAESERGEIFPRTRRSELEGMATFAELVQVWSRRIERIAGEFAAGRAEVAPTIEACKSCKLQGLCRVPAALEEADEFHE